jgi:hypothetical protein
MTIGQTKRIRRALVGALSPLMGTRATGTLTVRATSGPTELPESCFAMAIRKTAAGSEAIDRNCLLRTTAKTLVETGGTSVPVTSMLGGTRQNLPESTLIRWQPSITGIEELAAVAADMTGGTDLDAAGRVSSIVEFEGIGANAAKDLFQGRVMLELPAIVVAWDSSAGFEWAGQDKARHVDLWTLFVVVARQESAITRGDEGLDIMDGVSELLTDRRASDGIPLSAPNCALRGRRRVGVTPASYVYAVTIETRFAIKRRDTGGAADAARSFPPWLWTHFDFETDDPPKTVIDDAGYPMLAGAFGQGFSEGAFD